MIFSPFSSATRGVWSPIARFSAVWGPAHVEDTQYLRVFIGQLRAKVERDATAPKLIRTEPGVGYRAAEA